MKPKIDSFESERLVMEVRKEHHAYQVYELFCEKDLYLYTMRDVPLSAEWLAQGFKKLECLTSANGSELLFGWVAKEKESGEPVGVFEITIIADVAFIAYVVFKKHWRRGWAAEAVRAMMGYIEKNFKIQKFIIEMDTRNRASTKVAEKLEFDFVKVTNNATFLKNFVSHEFQFQKLVK